MTERGAADHGPYGEQIVLLAQKLPAGAGRCRVLRHARWCQR
jgi:hypothetical protein